MKKLGLVVLVLAACGDGKSVTPDAEPDAQTSCPPKTEPLMPGAYKIYLNFEGVTLTKGNDNAPMNIASVLMNDPTVIPMYQPTLSASTRQGRIDIIVGYVTRALAPYSVDVVTTRPVSGAYMMAVIGGKPENFGFPAGVGALVGQSCHANYLGVGLEFDLDAFTSEDIANSILSDIAMMAGMGGSTRHNDCANRTDQYDPGLICSFDAMSTTSATNNCGHTPTQNELQILMDTFDCRP